MRKRNIRKAAAALTALALCAGVLSGCGGAASSTASSAASSSAAASSEASGEDADEAAAKNVADLIDAIYVQERNDSTDEQCAAAKAAWDALTDAQKELVEGENADPDYFGRDTGDASKDDARNEDNIGENELLVVSFGTSFNDSRVKDIWKRCGLDRVVPRVYAVDVRREKNGVSLAVDMALTAVMLRSPVRLSVSWHVDGNGALAMASDVRVGEWVECLPRFGLQLELDGRMDTAEFFGFGPQESYVDKRAGAAKGQYIVPVRENGQPYIRPQETGSHCCTA